MSSALPRKCCDCEPLNCSDWCECAPAQLTLQITIQQTWEQIDNGIVTQHYEDELRLTDVVMVPECPCRINTVSGAWEYNASYYTKSYPLYTFYVNNNPAYKPCPGVNDQGCLVLQDCESGTIQGTGDLGAYDVVIKCDDPCDACLPQCTCFLSPTNVLEINLNKVVTEFFERFNECEEINGSGPPSPFTTAWAWFGQMLLRPGCIDLNSFKDTARISGMSTPYGMVEIAPADICNGIYPSYECIQPGGEIVVQFKNSWDVTSCVTKLCSSGHSCWNGVISTTPSTFVYECCAPAGSNPNIDRVFKHTGKITISVTIP